MFTVFDRLIKVVIAGACGVLASSLQLNAVETLQLDVICYDDFIQENQEALSTLKNALYQKGIVGIRGIPGYQEKVLNFIEIARDFSLLPEENSQTMFHPIRVKAGCSSPHLWHRIK